MRLVILFRAGGRRIIEEGPAPEQTVQSIDEVACRA